MSSSSPNLRNPLGGAAFDQRFSNYRFVTLGLAAFLAFSGGLNYFATGPITPLIIRDYGIHHSAAGLLTSVVALVHGGFSIPASLLLGRIGLKSLITLGAVASSAPVLSVLATDSFPLLLTLRAVHGLGFVILFPAVAPLFMQWFWPKELPLANGIFVTSASLGFATPAFVVVPLADAGGWAVALSVFGGCGLLGAIAWIVFGKAEPGLRAANAPDVAGRLWVMLSSRTTFVLTAAHIAPFSLLMVLVAWLPTYYNHAHGLSLQQGGMLTGLMSIAGVFALVLASVLTIRLFTRRPFLIFPGFLIGFAGLGTFVLADSMWVYVAVIAVGICCWFYIPALLTIPMDLYRTDPHRVAMMFAVIQTIEGITATIAVVTVGALFDLSGSLVPGLMLFSVLAWSLALGGILLPETGARRRSAAPSDA